MGSTSRVLALFLLFASLACASRPDPVPLPGQPILQGFTLFAREASEGLLALVEEPGARVLGREPWVVFLPASPSAKGLTHPHQRSYELAERLGADLVEPVLEILLPWHAQGLFTPAPPDCGAYADEDAEDDRWAVHQIASPAAWTAAQTAGKLAQLEAKDVVVGHLDTGYTEHPELWQVANGVLPVNVGRGKNYLGPGAPEDPLLGLPAVDSPGHGTASASVIVSPDGCQLQDQCGCVHGVARGGQIAPLRVTRRVAFFNQLAFEEALQDVAAGTLDVDLLSIALGSYPTWSMYLALLGVESRGTPAVAAAGNRTGVVVWPARFPMTIAAAGVNVGCTPWTESARGPAVDVSAPAHQVWRARVERGRCWGERYSNDWSSGTTYATGHTAGATALWVAHHGGALASLRAAGLTTEALRQLLDDTAWQPKRDPDPPGTYCGNDPPAWDEQQMGPGILHAGNLLGAALPTVASIPSPVRLGLFQLPLFASLLPPDTPDPAARTEAAYRRLLRAEPDVPLGEIARYEQEILFLYTLDEAFRNALEQFVKTAAEAPGRADPDAVWQALPRGRASSSLLEISEGRRAP